MTPAAEERSSSHAQNVRDAIDRITDTPFDKLPGLFDEMAKEADKAVRSEAALIEALEDADNTLCHLCGNVRVRQVIADALASSKGAHR